MRLTCFPRLNFAGGFPMYERLCRESLNEGFKGFDTQKGQGVAAA